MIRNEVQYRVTKSQVDRFESSLRELRENPPVRLAQNKELREIYKAGIQSQLDEMKEELAQYEALSRGDRVLRFTSFDELPTLLVQARIAAGLSQRDLADRLSMKEQQVQRYESTGYASASFSRLKQVALTLGLRVKKPAVLEPVLQEQPKRAARVHRKAAKSLKEAARKKASSERSSVRRKAAAAAAKKTPRRSAAKTRRK